MKNTARKHRLISSFLFLTIALNMVCAATPPDSLSRPFQIGERLTFRLRYGFVTAGLAEMNVLAQKSDTSRNVLHFQSTARSVGAFDWFYKVRDVVNAYVDAQTLSPLRFEKLLREGNYQADLFVHYFLRDSLAKVTYIRYKGKHKIRKKEQYKIKVPPNVHDVLSALYVLRTLPLTPNKPVFLTGHEKKKVYKLQIKVYPKETITVKAGTFRCIRIEPLLAGEGIFKHEGRLNIWLTDDNLKIPVQMTTKVIVGHITAELQKMSGVPRFIPAQIK